MWSTERREGRGVEVLSISRLDLFREVMREHEAHEAYEWSLAFLVFTAMVLAYIQTVQTCGECVENVMIIPPFGGH